MSVCRLALKQAGYQVFTHTQCRQSTAFKFAHDWCINNQLHIAPATMAQKRACTLVLSWSGLFILVQRIIDLIWCSLYWVTTSLVLIPVSHEHLVLFRGIDCKGMVLNASGNPLMMCSQECMMTSSLLQPKLISLVTSSSTCTVHSHVVGAKVL